MKSVLLIVTLCWIYPYSIAEGTKELRPSSSDYGNIEINDQGRTFALESNTDSLHRLYIHIKSTTEKIYFGFQPKDKTAGHGTFRIKDPSGTVVYTRTNVTTATGAGYIESYAEAIAGPKISGSPSGGYNPLSYTPTTTGDFYIEFTTTLAGTYHFDLFDITVVDVSNNPIHGRLWSYAWDISTQGATNIYNATMYVYTGDKYTTSVNFNGMQPNGFVVSCNSKGTQNTGNEAVDRQSVTGNQTYPEFKVFLNIPDPTVYSTAVIPSMVEDLKVIGSPISGSPVKFYLNMNKSGTVEIFLDLDGVAGYQAGNKDVAIVDVITAGGDTLIWNGKDATGSNVIQNVKVDVTSRYASGVTHFPIYDDEYSTNGIIVNRISPNASRAAVYWDDSQFGGTANFTGASGNSDGHNFPVVTGGYGNLRTINTWWNGYENNNLKSFTFKMDGTYLPICLSEFTALKNNNNITLSWITQSETNNDYFEIQRSTNGTQWETIAKISGSGNVTSSIQYSYTVKNTVLGMSYYRLNQVDFDGTSTKSAIISIFSQITQNGKVEFYTFPNPASESLHISTWKNDLVHFDISTFYGKNITSQLKINKVSQNLYSIDISKLEQGTYIISNNGTAKLCMKE